MNIGTNTESNPDEAIERQKYNEEIQQVKRSLHESEMKRNQLSVVCDDLEQKLKDQGEDNSTAKTVSIGTNADTETTLKDMAKLLQEKEQSIDDMKTHGEFVNKELAEKTTKIGKLQQEIKDLEEENQKIRTQEGITSQKYNKASKEKEEFENNYTAARQEIAQLIYLNDQLKNTNSQLLSKQAMRPQVVQQNSSKQPSEKKETSPGIDIAVEHDKNHHEDIENTLRRVCYSELKNPGSCRRGAECRYLHNIPQHIIADKVKMISMIGTQNLCVNEYRRKDSCIKGKECRFHHLITDEQREDPVIKERMKIKMERLRIRPVDDREDRQNHRICVHEFEQEGSCTRKEGCRFQHAITEEQRGDQVLREEIRKKANAIGSRKHINPPAGPKGVNIPMNMIHQMYNMLQNYCQPMRF